MSFANIAIGSKFFILRKENKEPVLEVGIVKSKVEKPPYPQQPTFPMMNNGMNNVPKNISIVVDVDGKDVQIPEIPSNTEIASDKDGNIYSASNEAMLDAYANMVTSSKQALAQMEYHKNVIGKQDSINEVLNPKYAEERQQAMRIKTLEDNVSDIKSMLASFMNAMNSKNS